MLKPGGETGLAKETLTHLLVVDTQHLQRDQPVDSRIEREVQDAHTALAEAVTNLISSNRDGARAHARPHYTGVHRMLVSTERTMASRGAV
jgi:precorrin-2 methylase